MRMKLSGSLLRSPTMVRLNQFGILSYIYGSKKNGNDSLLFSVVVRYFYRKIKIYCTNFLVGHCHLQIPLILAIDRVIKEKISFHHKLYFLFFYRKEIYQSNGKNLIMTVGSRGVLKSLHTN